MGGVEKGFADPWIAVLAERTTADAIWKRRPPLETPLPSGTLDAIEFISPAGSDRILEIWGVQLRAPDGLVRSLSLAHAK